jgi:hypothetical protein
VRRVMKKVDKEVAKWADLGAAARLAKVRSLVTAQAQSFSVLEVIRLEREAPAEEIEPVPPTEEAAPPEERPAGKGFWACIRSWLGLD